MSPDVDLWFRRYWPRPSARLRVVFFPHGGGSASFYRGMARLVLPTAEPMIAQYPGREDRTAERHLTEMSDLADRISAALLPALDRAFVLFGHSMGASVAHEVALRLEHRHGVSPALLCLSGRPAPRHHKPGDKHLDDEALWEDLARLGATPPLLLANPQVRRNVLPTLRADYRMVERYRPGTAPLLSCPVAACVGDADPEVTPKEAEAWQEVSRGGFTFRLFTGDHFYFRGQEDDLVRWLLTTTDREAA
ncbi:thioesterase II family protein [Streptomyces capoamus]|uniref:Thioesterase n=1 Tax=Streptomyces capoamus TaxID=68183 RepID=A0A919KD08_9ACTN|nr:alpha/beta fold hydrolase [Streptomyces capoamus]GGW20693.1 thioesterase [Streptomyces libani subsp. rufus]GHG57736.1 thioesterase [Streptomyces capoamus]